MKPELVSRIKDRIRREGRITFEAFMSMALYEPRLGYYASPETEIGRAGDFYTSPHLHPAFGWMMARQLEEMWDFMGKGPFTVVEQGPGKGWLARDILDHLKGREIYGNLGYCLCEVNPDLAKSQRGLLIEHKERLLWIESLAAVGPVKGVFLSNELLDAFPVHVVEKRNGRFMEVYAALDGDDFVEILGPASTPGIEKYFLDFPPEEELPEGYRTEVNLAMKGWLKEVADALEEGFVITVDYGWPAWEYLSPERNRGTLLGYFRHRVTENFFENIGEQDMTAHVNFSALKKWGEDVGLRCLGFCPQGTYLVSAGIDELMEGLSQDGILKIKGLLLPGTMGETHKIMIQYKGKGEPDLRGFRLRNLAGRL
jgi:SAM-dependent MidA family methyltransferase